jgi:hypothetical protein
MTKDEFEKLAFDGGAWEYLDLEGDSVARLIVYTLVLDAIKIEREACAKVADAAKADEADWDSNDWNQAVEFCANRIRARGQS